MSTSEHTHLNAGEAGADVVEATGVGLHVVEVALVILGGLLVAPPLLVMAVVVAVPAAVVLAVVGTVVAVIAAPIALVRRVRAHHREHGSTLFLHRLSPRSSHREPGIPAPSMAAARQHREEGTS